MLRIRKHLGYTSIMQNIDSSLRETLAFQGLQPEQIIAAVESLGILCDGRLLALNSYENRVYQIGIEDDTPLIGKFYRPHRWSDEQILEEHTFINALYTADIDVVPPLTIHGNTLHHHDAFRFSLYTRKGGHSPALDDPQQLEMVGRTLARVHLIGEQQPFQARPHFSVDTWLVEPASYLLEQQHIPLTLEKAYSTLIDDLTPLVSHRFDKAKHVKHLRLHGDCHPNNILTRGEALHLVDFDDARMGPAVQDLWMFISGDRQYASARLGDLLAGYTQFRDFDPAELSLIEPLRTLRIVHYAAWLAKRWEDAAFQQAFPWFDSPRYWDEHILTLREQVAALEAPPLIWD